MLMFPNFAHSCFQMGVFRRFNNLSNLSRYYEVSHWNSRKFLKIVARFKYIFLSQGLSVITKFSYFSYYVTFFDT